MIPDPISCFATAKLTHTGAALLVCIQPPRARPSSKHPSRTAPHRAGKLAGAHVVGDGTQFRHSQPHGSGAGCYFLADKTTGTVNDAEPPSGSAKCIPLNAETMHCVSPLGASLEATEALDTSPP